MIEKAGIPTMEVTRGGFTQVVGNAFAGFGFSAEAPTVYEFPIPMFVPGSDLTPINENIDKIVYGLTKWEPKIKEKGVIAPPEVTVEGKDYAEAVDNMHNLFLRNMWGDGLAFLPPTEDRVNWILRGTDLPPDTVIGKILPRGGMATVEQTASALAMAGGRPEYLSVLLATVESIVEPESHHEEWQATTNSTYPAIVVSGPIAKQIRLNSGYGCLGPDPQHPAGGSIGRALRLILQDQGGALPGIGTMAVFGGPMKYTNIVVAEDEEGIPPNWPSLAVERGFPKGSTVVTLFAVNCTNNIGGGSPTSEEAARGILGRWGSVMTSCPCSGHAYGRPLNPDGAPGLLLMARGTAKAMADLGLSKLDVQTGIWEATKLPWAEVEGSIKMWTDIGYNDPKYAYERDLMPIGVGPRNMIFAVAGGAQSGHAYWMSTHAAITKPISKEIKLPANWDELLAQAEEDLGALPAA